MTPTSDQNMQSANRGTGDGTEETFGHLLVSVFSGAVKVQLDDIAPGFEWLLRGLKHMLLTPQTVALTGFGVGALLALAFFPATGSAGWLVAAERAVGVSRSPSDAHVPVSVPTPVTTPARQPITAPGGSTSADRPNGDGLNGALPTSGSSESATAASSVQPLVHPAAPRDQGTHRPAPRSAALARAPVAPAPAPAASARAGDVRSSKPAPPAPVEAPTSSGPGTSSSSSPSSGSSDRPASSSQSSAGGGQSSSAGSEASSSGSQGSSGGQIGVDVHAGPINAHLGI